MSLLRRFDHVGAYEVAYAVEGGFEDGAEGGELGSVVGHEAGELRRRHVGAKLGDFGGIMRGRSPVALYVAAGFEDEVVLGIEADKVDFVVEAISRPQAVKMSSSTRG